MPKTEAPRGNARRAHLCACRDPTAHTELRQYLGRQYVAVRAAHYKVAIKALRFAGKRIDDLTRDNVSLAKENARLRGTLKGRFALNVATPVLRNGLGDRTAVGSYRESLGELVNLVNELGVRAQVSGRDVAELFLMGPVKMDIESLWAAPPATEEEGQRRDDIRHRLSMPHERELLIRPDEIGEACRRQLISDVAGSGVDTSVQELVRRSPAARMGKVSRSDDED